MTDLIYRYCVREVLILLRIFCLGIGRSLPGLSEIDSGFHVFLWLTRTAVDSNGVHGSSRGSSVGNCVVVLILPPLAIFLQVYSIRRPLDFQAKHIYRVTLLGLQCHVSVTHPRPFSLQLPCVIKKD